MLAAGLFLLLIGWLLVYAGIRNVSIGAEIRAAFGA